METDLINICLYYGIRKQIKKLSEETFELHEAVIDRLNKPDLVDTIRIASEIADIMVLIEQIRLFYCLRPFEIENIMKMKIERQLKRINDEIKKENYGTEKGEN